MIQPAVFLGDFAAERTVLIASVPLESQQGAQARGVSLLVGEDARFTKQDHWAVQFGKIKSGIFHLIGRELALDGPISSLAVRRVDFESPVQISRGEAMAVRVSPRGLPSPLVGVSLVPDWSAISSRSPTNG